MVLNFGKPDEMPASQLQVIKPCNGDAIILKFATPRAKNLCGRPTTIFYSALKATIFVPFIRDTPCKGGNKLNTAKVILGKL